MRIFDADKVKDVLNETLTLMLGHEPDVLTTTVLDVTGILKSIIVNRLNIDDYELAKPTTLKVINVKPEFSIIVVRVKLAKHNILVGTEFIQL